MIRRACFSPLRSRSALVATVVLRRTNSAEQRSGQLLGRIQGLKFTYFIRRKEASTFDLVARHHLEYPPDSLCSPSMGRSVAIQSRLSPVGASL